MYPSYSSYRALRSRELVQTRRWLLYWSVLGVVRCVEVVGDVFLGWVPFYEEAKLGFYVWLVFPGLSGFVYLFRSHINPLLMQHHEQIESSVDRMVEFGRRTMGVPGSGLERLAALCRSAGIPTGSDSESDNGRRSGSGFEEVPSQASSALGLGAKQQRRG